MTEHLTLNTVVHAAFRRTITRLDGALAGFPDGSQHRGDQFKGAWDFFEEELHQYHGHEEKHFWPAVQRTEAGLRVLAELDSEHEAMRKTLGQATQAMVVLQKTPTANNTVSSRAAVAHLGGCCSTITPTKSGAWNRSPPHTRTHHR